MPLPPFPSAPPSHPFLASGREQDLQGAHKSLLKVSPVKGLEIKLLPLFPRSHKDPIGLVLPSGLLVLLEPVVRETMSHWQEDPGRPLPPTPHPALAATTHYLVQSEPSGQ